MIIQLKLNVLKIEEMYKHIVKNINEFFFETEKSKSEVYS